MRYEVIAPVGTDCGDVPCYFVSEQDWDEFRQSVPPGARFRSGKLPEDVDHLVLHPIWMVAMGGADVKLPEQMTEL